MELDLRSVEVVVFDEADSPSHPTDDLFARLFEMGFAVQLHEILYKLPSSRQTMLFSATLPSVLVDFAKAGLQDPSLIRLDVDTKISKDLEMAFFVVKTDEKEGALLCLLRDVLRVPKAPVAVQDEQKGDGAGKGKGGKRRPPFSSKISASGHQTIVFVSTKHHVEYLGTLLEQAGYCCSMIYGSMDQTARKIHISKFRDGRTNILVVTDVAARGIDIPVLENVVNYDFVDSSKVFVHRVGRAARAGRRGWAYSLLTAEDLPYLIDLQLFLGRPLVLGRCSTSVPSYTTEITLGALPRDSVGLDVEWVQDLLGSVPDANALRRTADNGRRLYCKSRPSAAPESYKRAKELAKEKSLWEVHPLVARLMLLRAKPGDEEVQREVERSNFLASLSSFRPAETIFEVGSKGGKMSAAGAVMKQRREIVRSLVPSSRNGITATDDDKAAKENTDESCPRPEILDPVQLKQAGEDEIVVCYFVRRLIVLRPPSVVDDRLCFVVPSVIF
ncbi:MAG: P-loop containing nucleoside triphosphate hydrolase protein [Olpidium bornovanus]|uniref:P-loop containing nucleoside triphosphate hydrolase protein n=1 Tax=Olpidium bornovanus TaxID=278681 RepID=A0A8H7ZNZ5_9FUNG|nr:MAG: P-loop containing nucleoside triphosphate hydrolase protein [Olpidium bornovanus]